MTPRDRGHGRTSRIPQQNITRRPSMVHVNTDAHITLDDTVKNAITMLGRLTHELNLFDEYDAATYSRRVSGALAYLTPSLVARILEELGGDPSVHRTLSSRIAAVQTIVTSTAYWGRP